MAKIRGFLSGAKGKIGDFVVQKGEKQTIIRANNGVSNPQSASQMAQRLAFATATNAAKKMLSVIGLSFYGVSNGKLSRRKFVALNAPILKAAADAAIAGEDEWANPTCHFKAKDVNQLVPNPYIVSDGSLVLPEQVSIIKNDSDKLAIVGETNAISLEPGEGSSVTGYDIIRQLFGVDSGNQLTLCVICGKSGESVAYAYEQGENVTVNGVPMLNYDWMRFTKFVAPRIVFKGSDFPSVTVEDGETIESFKTKMQTAIRNCVNMEKSSEAFVNWITNAIEVTLQAGQFTVSLKAEVLPSTIGGENYNPLAAAMIRSANVEGVWDFTRSQMVVAMDLDTAGGPEANDNYSGLSIGNAIYTYVGVADSANKNFMTTGTPYDEMPVQ